MNGPGDLVLLFSIILYLQVVTLILFYEIFIKKTDSLEPLIVFVLFYTFFVLPLPIRAYVTNIIEGSVTPYMDELYPYLPSSVLLSTIGLLILFIVYHSKLVYILAIKIPLPPAVTPKGSRFAFLFLMGLSILLCYLLSLPLGGVMSLFLKGYAASAELFGKGYLAICFPWAFIAILFLLQRYALYHKIIDIAAFCVFFASMVFIQLVMGNRSLIITMALATFFFVHYSIRRFRAWEIFFFGLLAFITLSIYGLLRSSFYEGIDFFITNTKKSFVNIIESGQLIRSMFYTITIGEFVVPFETFPQMIRTVGHEIQPLFGLSFIRAPIYYIPQVIFPDRPLPLSNWYMKTFYGNEFGLHQGRQFFFLAEGYLNFGIPGVFMVMAIWGIFLGVLRVYKNLADGEPGALLIYAVTLAFIFRAIAGDFTSLVVGFPTQNLVPALIGLLISTNFRRWRLAKRRSKL